MTGKRRTPAPPLPEPSGTAGRRSGPVLTLIGTLVLGVTITAGLVVLDVIPQPADWFTAQQEDEPTADRATDAVDEPIEAEVIPGQPVRIDLPDGTRITGPRGAVTEPGTITVTPSTWTPTIEDPVHGRELTGFDLVTTSPLKRPLTVSFPAPARPDGRRTDWIPAAVHVEDTAAGSASTSYQTVNARGGRFEIVTDDFSFWAPSWLDPGAWLNDLFSGAKNLLTGTTPPPDCTNASMSWATLTNGSDLVHSCLKDNRDGSGTSRAEVYLKSNRPYFTKISTSPDADYRWQSKPDDLFGAALATVSSRDGDVVLPPGEAMSVGYRQPPLDAKRVLTPYSDLFTIGLTLTKTIIDKVTPDDRSGFAALWAVVTCSNNIPADIVDAGAIRDLLVCVFTDALPQLDNEYKATAAARSLIELNVDTLTPEGARKLQTVSDKTKLVGQAMKVFGLLEVIRSQVMQIVDGLYEANNGRSSAVLDLTAGTRSTTSLLNAAVPGSSCSSRDGQYGWGGPNPVKLVNGIGSVEQPPRDGSSYSPVTGIQETRVVGWANFDADPDREVALLLRCSGSTYDMCCAGQSSLLWYLGVFDVPRSGPLAQVGESFSGSSIYPGDRFGPANGAIAEAKLSGTTFNVRQYILYSDSYSSRELGGRSKYEPFPTAHNLQADGTWTNVDLR